MTPNPPVPGDTVGPNRLDAKIGGDGKGPRSRAGGPWSLVRALIIGTIVVAVLDALDAIVVFGLRSGVSPMRIFQGIASGLIGPQAFAGGVRTALLGVVLHVVIAGGIVTTCLALGRLWPWLVSRPLVFGPIYGIAVYLVMNLVVIPLSAIGTPSFNTFSVINGVLIHVLGVGIPAALVASRASGGRARVDD
jgi:hypothetical protein